MTTDNLTEFSAEVTIIAAWIAAAAWMVYLVGAITDAYALRGGALLAWVVSVLGDVHLAAPPAPYADPITACGWIGSAAIAISIVLGPIATAPTWVIGVAAHADRAVGDRPVRRARRRRLRIVGADRRGRR